MSGSIVVSSRARAHPSANGVAGSRHAIATGTVFRDVGLVLHSQAARLVHELALMESVVDAVVEQIGAQRVTRVRLEIGRLSGVAIDAMRFSFDVCVKGTTLDGAELDIVEIAGFARCRTCGSEQATSSLASPCSCGSFDRLLVRGDELRLTEVEVL